MTGEIGENVKTGKVGVTLSVHLRMKGSRDNDYLFKIVCTGDSGSGKTGKLHFNIAM